jgi:hypothetical protein
MTPRVFHFAAGSGYVVPRLAQFDVVWQVMYPSKRVPPINSLVHIVARRVYL